MRYLFSDEERLQNTYRTDLRFQWARPSADRPGQDGPSSERGAGDGWAYTSTLDITLTPNASRTLDWLQTFSSLGSHYELLPHEEEAATVAVPYQETVLAG